MRVAVIGAGSWGTAIAALLGGKGFDVRLWAREPEIAEGINAAHRNPLFLKDIALAESVWCSTDIQEALSGAEAVVTVCPSHGVRAVAQAMKPYLSREMPIVNLAKGVERESLMRMTEVLEDVLGNRMRLAALSGPNHAEEVSKNIPSATVIAAYDEKVGQLFQDLFMAPAFRVYTNPDVVGVELCAASKNVVAIAAGMSDGLGYGDNTKATLMTRGLAEMSRLGTRLGANPLTYMGLAGMGDLIATCTSPHSRNRGLGEHIARGGSIESYAKETNMVAEGAISCISLDGLGAREGIDLPITHGVRTALHEGAALDSVATSLMGREAKDELHGMGLVTD